MSLVEFRQSLKESMLSLAWAQWTALGVAGQIERRTDHIIDPEALILFTAFIGREDQRLFDLVLDWLQVNGRFVNTQRLRTLSKLTAFECSDVLGYMASSLSRFESRVRWNRLSELLVPNPQPERTPLFKNAPLSDAQERDPNALCYGLERNVHIPSGKVLEFSTESFAALLLRLRGFLGVSSRCEVLLALLCNDYCTIQETAKAGGYSWRSVQDVLFEMNRSGCLGASEAKRGRYYFLKNREQWLKNMGIPAARALTFPRWLNVYNVCASLSCALDDPRLERVSALSVQGAVQDVFTKAGPSLMECGIGDLRFVSAANYQDIPGILERL